eukprot:CAMPEP_0206427770 /NCGR_PEP_ID=MMETSP0324_2-20121206/5243_1 /ASSEMBLY_ACC=CAM_ASM_000836 /TAXON_ID=2866 /ORGANISM="Crypthecodinium cohnii, Strain Seligo" /LENGTH=530 /DNA_ID=CAMNT_0053893123 /DNA_START=254 /DNA_END=1846 /DNA_ORIENTATION=-
MEFMVSASQRGGLLRVREEQQQLQQHHQWAAAPQQHHQWAAARQDEEEEGEEEEEDDDEDEEDENDEAHADAELGKGDDAASVSNHRGDEAPRRRNIRHIALGLVCLVFVVGCSSLGSRLRIIAAVALGGGGGKHTSLERTDGDQDEEGVENEEPSWTQLYELKLGRQVYHLEQATAGITHRSPTPIRTISNQSIVLCVVQSNLIAIQLARLSIGIVNSVAMCANDGLGSHRENATCSIQFMAMFITISRVAALMSSIPSSCDAYSYQTKAGCSGAAALMLAETETIGIAADILDSFCSANPSWIADPDSWPQPVNKRPFGTRKLPEWLNMTKENLALCVLSVDQATLVLVRDILLMINAHSQCTATQFDGCAVGDSPKTCREKAHNFTMQQHSCTRKWQCSSADSKAVCLGKIRLCHLNNERQPVICSQLVLQSFSGILLAAYWLAGSVAACGNIKMANCAGAGIAMASSLASFASAGMQMSRFCGEGGKDQNWMLAFNAYIRTTTTEAASTTTSTTLSTTSSALARWG